MECPCSPEAVAWELASALRDHQSGRLAAATQRYQSILAQLPGYADALHLLGVVALRQDRRDVTGHALILGCRRETTTAKH